MYRRLGSSDSGSSHWDSSSSPDISIVRKRRSQVWILLLLSIPVLVLWAATSSSASSAIASNLSAASAVWKHATLGADEPDLDSVRYSKYSIVISTYNRFEYLQQLLDHNGNGDLPNLDAIHIVWMLGDVDPPAQLKLDSYGVPVHLVRAQRYSLTERFRLPPQMQTEAALWVDDDIVVSPSALEFAWRAWKQYGRPQHQIGGMVGRSHSRDVEGRLTYGFDQKHYSMAITGLAFLDRSMLEWFWGNPKIEEAISYVDKVFNCEDILMNFIVSGENKLPPLLIDVQADRDFLASQGISNRPGHLDKRSACMQKFEELFGLTLKVSDIAISQSPEIRERQAPLGAAYRPKSGVSWGDSRVFRHNDTSPLSS